MAEQMTASPRRRRNIVAWFLFIVLLAGLIAWLVTSVRCGRALRASARDMALTTANAVSTFGNPLVAQRDWPTLQRYADNLVREGRVAYVAIVDRNDIAVVHTDRAQLGKEYVPPEGSRDREDASASVRGTLGRLATVRVGVMIKGR